jgi:hypothetical protein
MKKTVALPPDIKKYLENRETEVKYYDEKTGLANPDYEKLTGKKNPLDGYPESIIAPRYEPKMVSRWIVNLPEWMNIPSYVIFKTQRPTSYLSNKNFFGIDLGNQFEWDPITIELRDPIGSEIPKELLKIINNDTNISFSYTLEILDPAGVCDEKWLFTNCILTSVEFGELDYTNKGVLVIKLGIKIGKAELV